MATYTITGATAGVPVGVKPQIVEVVLDFSTTNLTTSDSVEVFELPANTLVIMAGLETLTVASTGSPVLDLGDDADDDIYAAAVAGHTAVATGTTSGRLLPSLELCNQASRRGCITIRSAGR